ncbi:XRE family transcriptional regulator [Vibrio parahaemolyticus]|uniref:XRE family transcriptional regulator n=1 Tax=Vibrio parahaemolyticus TaxID=670 RepID=UPI001B82F368|nr:XRE family transcriptional regulator [Vibrio parahaemolyticus]UJW96448.1 XRE family transcriptional regulator [Vibrio parahaemolyticus]HBB9944260.1 XRE family transcriptional regulator [Vibrio parahaemolyticus]HBC3416012.1 XRE family transcriptional regulator [Vibrio parahaemolyticus]HBC3601659.1 XRE family transcriptional regulator [Vibrio parahaemolyticus]HBC3877609.1 XRE family transcriptional regulator [Vibrio parahaemolyticus]
MNNWKAKRVLQVALIEYMQHNNLTQAKAASEFGVSQASVSRLVNGKWERLRNSSIENIAQKLGVMLKPDFQLKLEHCGEIEKAVIDVWDGTEQHAKAIANMIRAANAC